MVSLNRSTVFNHIPSLDELPNIAMAIESIKKETGDKVSVQTANKFYQMHTKVDKPENEGDMGVLIQQLAGDEADVVYLTDNLITHIVSSETWMLGVALVYGQTISDGKFSEIFAQEITFNGQNPVELQTPICRVHSAINTRDTWGWGTIYVYQGTSSVTDGIPDTDSMVHLMNRQLNTGENPNNVFAGHFTVPDGHYFILKNSEIGQVRSNNSLFVDAEVQIAEYGKSFITKRVLSGGNAGTITGIDDNLIYAPPNSTLRMWGHFNGSNDANEALANFSGYLGKIIN